jgi:pilus assembly protein CpaC
MTMDCRMQAEPKHAARRAAPILLALVLALAIPAWGFAAAREATPVSVVAGQSLVLEMAYDVSTVSIADAKVADAAVGSERTVVVNGKAPGVTTLVVWEEGGRHTAYRVTTLSNRPAPPQVLLECKIAELDDQRLSEFGLDWIAKGTSHEPWIDGTVSGGLFTTKVETPSNPLILGPTTDGFLTYSKLTGNFNFMTTLRAMEQNGAARVIASPNLVASSGDSASFLAGGEFPVPVSRASGGDTEGGVATTVTIEWKEFGVKLNFVPTVLDSNRIRLQVAPEVSAPDQRYAVLLNGYYVPSVITRRATTTVELGDTDVLVIGGLKQTETSKIVKKFPIFGDVPLLGWFFKTRKTESHDRDLVIAVSPRIVRQMLRAFPETPAELKKN